MHLVFIPFFLISLIKFTLCNLQCGKQATNHQPRLRNERHRIIGGNIAIPHSWPWMALLRVNGEPDCGAVMIPIDDKARHSDVLLTAAHCVTTGSGDETTAINATDLDVVIGVHKINRYSPRQVYPVAKVIIYPDFDPQYRILHHDVAIIILKIPANFTSSVRPVCLPGQWDSVPYEQLCVAAGWGETSNGIFSSTLIQVDVTVCDSGLYNGIRFNQNNETFTDMDKIAFSEQTICAGSFHTASGIGNGDSGGMLACTEVRKRSVGHAALMTPRQWTLYGVASYFYPKTPDVPTSIFTRVSNYARWIQRRLLEIKRWKRNGYSALISSGKGEGRKLQESRKGDISELIKEMRIGI